MCQFKDNARFEMWQTSHRTWFIDFLGLVKCTLGIECSRTEEKLHYQEFSFGVKSVTVSSQTEENEHALLP